MLTSRVKNNYPKGPPRSLATGVPSIDGEESLGNWLGGLGGVEGGAASVPARVLEEDGDLPHTPYSIVKGMWGWESPNNGPQ